MLGCNFIYMVFALRFLICSYDDLLRSHSVLGFRFPHDHCVHHPKEVPYMACVKEYIHNNAHIRIMDDDVVSPEEQALILK